MPGLAPAPPEQLERRALTASLIATAVLGAVAIVWGIASGARVVIFDGIYQLAGIVLVASSMLAARTAASPPSTDYPFGRHAATPLAVALQGAALLATLAYGAVDAVTVILAGGSAAAGISVLAYGVVSPPVPSLSSCCCAVPRGRPRWRTPRWSRGGPACI